MRVAFSECTQNSIRLFLSTVDGGYIVRKNYNAFNKQKMDDVKCLTLQ